MKTVIVIPARYNSTRFPGKVIYPLNEKPIIQWVWEKALKTKITDEIIIATEDEKVIETVKKFGGNAVLTSPGCPSGSDRVWEVVKNKDYDIIINLQADEPFINPSVIRKAYKKILKTKEFDITTAVSPIKENNEINNENCVKVAFGKNGKALYFSRTPIPYHHNLSKISTKIPYYKHCGFYIYKKQALKKFVSAPCGKLELLERLEQLRALEIGLRIGVVIVKDIGPALDSPEDIEKLIKYLKKGSF